MARFNFKKTEVLKMQSTVQICNESDSCFITFFDCQRRAQVLNHLLDVALPKAGVSPDDRCLLKEALKSHFDYRSSSGGNNVSWQARLNKSGIQIFELIEARMFLCHLVIVFIFSQCAKNAETHVFFVHPLQALVYCKKFDSAMRGICRQGGSPEAILESEGVATEWKKIQDALANEEAERKVAAGEAPSEEAEETTDAAAEVLTLRKGPTAFTQGSAAYWRAVANQVVRTYCQIAVEATSLDGVSLGVSQCNLKDLRGSMGESCVLIHLDVDLLGETYGPNCQESLRKRFNPENGLLRKLLHGALLGRGAQRRTEEGEATTVPEGDLVAIHSGVDRATSNCKALFRLSTAKKGDMDSEIKDLLVTFDDESVRNRKKRVRGAYSTYSTYILASGQHLTNAVPERQYPHHKGYCAADVFGPVKAIKASDLWHATRT